MKKIFACLLPLLCAVLLLSAGPARAAEKMTVLLDWFVNPDHAPLYVALEKGFFKEKGLEVELIAPSNPNDPPKLVAAGKADIAVSYQHQHQMQVDQGLPLVRIATLIATPLNSLVALEDGPIKKIADLKGKTIGYSVGGFETALLKVMLEKEGLKIEDVKLVNVNFSLSPSLFTGQTDAVIGAFRNFELNQMAIEKRPGRAFFVEEYGVPAYDELILVANAKAINDPMMRKFVDALEEGVQYLINHPDESWKLFVSHGRENLDDELNRRAWKDTLPRFALRPGALDKNRYNRFAKFLQKEKIVTKVPPLDTWAVELP
ncbi:ABC transporter substrate-binding protein [uncultured Desulfobulbus sp.]|uniref:ABC transporter substrate-binding protein n=1 Tax=uncultured Desulfobulbus sp. TaxID=239745 RepID=UPI0029C74CD6|nr:ABC transporter substrate-binding protein [uncultured Desulfobulbus sp.]